MACLTRNGGKFILNTTLMTPYRRGSDKNNFIHSRFRQRLSIDDGDRGRIGYTASDFLLFFTIFE
jgi:hypothetical protein